MLKPPFIKTPLVSPALLETPFKVLYKSEFLQPSQSFKSRGLGQLIAAKINNALETRKPIPNIFSSSGGNAGYAAAIACRLISQQLNVDVKCTVVVPEVTNPRMQAKIADAGAQVIVHGKHWGEADAHLRNNVMKGGNAVYCHPFDDPLVWEGHSSMIDEIVEQFREQDLDLKRFKGIVCSVGGGGMYNGIVQGLQRHSLRTPVIAVETELSNCLNESLKTGKQCTIVPKSVATSLGAPSPSLKTLELAATHPTISELVSDRESIDACFRFMSEHNVLIEPACGASLTTVYRPIEYFKTLETDDIVVVVVCGGSTVSYSELASL